MSALAAIQVIAAVKASRRTRGVFWAAYLRTWIREPLLSGLSAGAMWLLVFLFMLAVVLLLFLRDV